jgi:hypothetical protein
MEIIIQDRRPDRHHETAPIPGAYLKSFVAHQVCKFKTDFVKRYYLKATPEWYTMGYNHVDSLLEISRDLNCTAWCIKMETPEELFEFISKGQNGDENYEIYLTTYTYDDTMPAINIR